MVDMDNVITDGIFNEFLEEFLGEKIDINSSKVYYRQELIKGREDEFKQVYQYRNLYKNAPLLDGCYEVLEKLNNKYDIYIVTSYIWEKDIISAEENLKNKFQYLQQKLPFINPSKYIFTQNKKIMNFDIRIDDRLSGLENSNIKLLFDSWSNKTITNEELKKNNIIRVKDWYDVENVLKEIDTEYQNMRLTEINTQNITDDIIKKVLFSTIKSEFLEADCLIIFGCHLKPLLDERLECAIKILKSKKIDTILLTGGIGVNGNFNESEYMKKALLNFGIAENKILVDDRSTTTEENIVNSIQILRDTNLINNKKIVLVSNQAHLRRIGMELKKQLNGDKFDIIYEYPENSIISFDNVKNDNDLRNLATNEVKKIIRFIEQGIVDDEEIDFN